jgi:hypothetical protein
LRKGRENLDDRHVSRTISVECSVGQEVTTASLFYLA